MDNTRKLNGILKLFVPCYVWAFSFTLLTFYLSIMVQILCFYGCVWAHVRVYICLCFSCFFFFSCLFASFYSSLFFIGLFCSKENKSSCEGPWVEDLRWDEGGESVIRIYRLKNIYKKVSWILLLQSKRILTKCNILEVLISLRKDPE